MHFITLAIVICLSVWITIISAQLTCKYNEYYDSDAGTCKTCSETCGACLEEGSTDCNACFPPLILLKGECITACPQGYKANLLKNKCIGCFRNCNVCPDDFKMFNSFCVSVCPAGTTDLTSASGNAACKEISRVSSPIIIFHDTLTEYANLSEDIYIDIEILSRASYTVSWSCNDPNLLLNITATAPSLLIPASKLSPGRVYELQILVTNEIGNNTQKKIFRTVGAATTGTIQIVPQEIVAAETEFSITLSNFSGERAFLVDILAVQMTIEADEYYNCRYTSANISQNNTTRNIYNPILLAKSLQNDPSGLNYKTKFPPVKSSTKYKIIVNFYNLYDKMSIQADLLVLVQENVAISQFQPFSTIMDVLFTSRLIGLAVNFTNSVLCYESGNILQFSKLYGDATCPKMHCNNNGYCELTAKRPTCTCNGNFTGVCCQIYNQDPAYSYLMLLPSIVQYVATTAINTDTYGSIVHTIIELSYLTSYLDAKDITNLITVFEYILNQYYFTIEISGELYTAWSNIRTFSQETTISSYWAFKLDDLNVIQDALVQSITNTLNYDIIYQSQSFYLSTYHIKVAGENFLTRTSAPSIGAQSTDSYQSDVRLPSQYIEGDIIQSYKVSVMNTSFYIPKSSNVVTNDLIHISIQQYNSFLQANVSSTSFVSLNMKNNHGEIIFRDSEDRIKVAIPKRISLLYPLYNNLYECTSIEADDLFVEQSCDAFAENSTHIICSCNSLESVNYLTGKAISKFDQQYKLACSIDGALAATPNQFRILFGSFKDYTKERCTKVIKYFDTWKVSGLILAIVYVGYYVMGCIVVFFVDTLEQKQKKKQALASGGKKKCSLKCSNITSLSAFCSIAFFNNVYGGSRLFRWTLWWYLKLNILGWGLAYNDILSSYSSLPFWSKSTFGLVTAWILYYLTIGTLYLSQERRCYLSKQSFQLKPTGFVIIAVVIATLWSAYFIFRVGILDVSSILDQITAAVLLGIIESTIFDALIIIVCSKWKKARKFFKCRGFYSSGNEKTPIEESDGLQLVDLASPSVSTMREPNQSTNRMFFAASRQESFDGPLGPLSGTVLRV